MREYFNIYCESIGDSIIPEWINEINKLGMECEIHPDFSFFKNIFEYIPFRILIKTNSHKKLVNKNYISLVNLSISDFDFSEQYSKDHELNHVSSSHLKSRLVKCKKQLFFDELEIDTLGFRMVTLASATLAKLVDGVYLSFKDGFYQDNDTIIEQALNKVENHEKALKPRNITVYNFEEWDSQPSIKLKKR